ncbi:MAG: twin-arginine translocation signal domain-containing protein, partial [Candidatus Thermoplasmatota archaeon]|nr:twin-arginine translocation signal domain-containing protein [Candidatus Thermoplasmatota archaeon]
MPAGGIAAERDAGHHSRDPVAGCEESHTSRFVRFIFRRFHLEGFIMNRRNFLKGVSGGLVLGGASLALPRMPLAAPVSMGPAELPAGTLEASFLDALPGKKPLIKRTFRPPNYETPVAYFNDLYTPNDAFFVRYHIVNIPEVAAESWKLRIGGEALQKP